MPLLTQIAGLFTGQTAAATPADNPCALGFAVFEGQKIPIPQIQDDPFHEDSWQICSPAALRRHIDRDHFSPYILSTFGVPRYDLELCRFRRIAVGPVVERALTLLGQDDYELHCQLSQMRLLKNYGVVAHYRALVKTLRYIEELNLSAVDWRRAEAAFPGASGVTLDLAKDTIDISFDTTVLASLAPWQKRFFENGGFDRALLRSAGYLAK